MYSFTHVLNFASQKDIDLLAIHYDYLYCYMKFAATLYLKHVELNLWYLCNLFIPV